MITAAQIRAARALLGVDQRALAALTGLSLPTIQRMEASDGVIRGNVDSLMKLVAGLEGAGIVLIGEGVASPGGGRGVRLARPPAAANDDALAQPAPGQKP
jgi:transcriptional regulator with XRE-family HTH domain